MIIPSSQKDFDIIFIVLLIYVDDIVIVGCNIDNINHVKIQLHNTFNLKDLGDLNFLLALNFLNPKQTYSFMC